MKLFVVHKFLCIPIIVSTLLGLASCGGSSGGGGGNGGVTTANGVFKDSNVSGLSYESGGQSGTTATDGGFTYEVGQPVIFSLGGVTIGSASGQSVITPINLVSAGNSSNVTVQNIVRFFLMLDSDGDPSNGIDISDAVQNIADNWTQVDFTSSDIASDLISIISDVASVDSRTPVLPDASAAQAHLESTLLCVRAGAYRGTFVGTDNGPFGVLVDANSGFLSGFAYSNGDQALLALAGTTAISFDQSAGFISGDASTGATFTGQFAGPDNISGTWELLPDMGTFSGSRIGGSVDAAYRFTGSFTGDAFGLFTFDVDTSDNVQGVAYTLASTDDTVDELSNFTGSVSGTNLTATVSDNGVTDATITGTLNTDTGILNGTWSDVDGNNGSFAGRGCQLN